MPIYEYRCEDCEQIFEEWQRNFEDKQAKCPVCGACAERIISNTSFILKGSGWYVTDYCDRKGVSGNGNSNGSSAKAADSNGSSDSSGSDAKSSQAAPAESKPEPKKTKASSDSAKA